MAVAKVVLNGTSLIDVTSDTVTDQSLLSTYTATKNDGTKISGAYVAPTILTQSKSATPTTSAQSIFPDTGYYLSQVNVEAIPSAYIIPSGTLSITANGSGIDVGSYASVDVNVPGGGGTDTEDVIIMRTISGTYENSRVTSIGNYAFTYCYSLSSVVFANCLSIGLGAFSYCSNLMSISFPSCTFVSSYAFDYCSALTSVNLPECMSVGMYAFRMCSSITTFEASKLSNIATGAFYSCYKLTDVDFPNCSYIGSSAFYNCSALESAYFVGMSYSIQTSAFCSCQKLSDISFPQCAAIGGGAFSRCTELSSISFPFCTQIAASAFYYCIKLSNLYFPTCSSIFMSAFAFCGSISSAYFPACSIISAGAFYSCTSLEYAFFPIGSSISNSAFTSCWNLSTAIFATCSTSRGSIGASTFSNCYNLLSLYLLGSLIYSLGNTNAFLNTPISTYTTSTGGVYGSIFVPESLYSDYIASTNWVTYSDRFVSMTDAQIKAAFPFSVNYSSAFQVSSTTTAFYDYMGIPFKGHDYNLYFYMTRSYMGYTISYEYSGSFTFNQPTSFTISASKSMPLQLYIYCGKLGLNMGGTNVNGLLGHSYTIEITEIE